VGLGRPIVLGEADWDLRFDLLDSYKGVQPFKLLDTCAFFEVNQELQNTTPDKTI
jgi:hypothetical protein